MNSFETSCLEVKCGEDFLSLCKVSFLSAQSIDAAAVFESLVQVNSAVVAPLHRRRHCFVDSEVLERMENSLSRLPGWVEVILVVLSDLDTHE